MRVLNAVKLGQQDRVFNISKECWLRLGEPAAVTVGYLPRRGIYISTREDKKSVQVRGTQIFSRTGVNLLRQVARTSFDAEIVRVKEWGLTAFLVDTISGLTEVAVDITAVDLPQSPPSSLTQTEVNEIVDNDDEADWRRLPSTPWNKDALRRFNLWWSAGVRKQETLCKRFHRSPDFLYAVAVAQGLMQDLGGGELVDADGLSTMNYKRSPDELPQTLPFWKTDVAFSFRSVAERDELVRDLMEQELLLAERFEIIRQWDLKREREIEALAKQFHRTPAIVREFLLSTWRLEQRGEEGGKHD